MQMDVAFIGDWVMEAAVSDGSNGDFQLGHLSNLHGFLRFWDFWGPDHHKHVLSQNLATVAYPWSHLRLKSRSVKEEYHGQGDYWDLPTRQKNLAVFLKYSPHFQASQYIPDKDISANMNDLSEAASQD